MTPEQEVNRGILAQQVAENPVYQESITVVRAKLMEDWAGTKWYQVRKREAIWRMYRAIDGIEGQINRVMQTGQLGRKTIDHREKLKSFS